MLCGPRPIHPLTPRLYDGHSAYRPFDGGRVWTSSVSAMAHRLAQWAHNRDMSSSGTGTTRALPGSPFNQPAVAIVTSYAMSDRVSHDRYGLGTVVGTENGNAAVLVDFGPKVLRVALPTTKMVKL